MKLGKLSEMKRGWFVGDFIPSLLNTDLVEAAVKTYCADEYEASHYHKVATEVTVIVSGKVMMNGIEYQAGSIIVMEPGEVTDFKAIMDTVNVVIKIPCVKNDKYEENINENIKS